MGRQIGALLLAVLSYTCGGQAQSPEESTAVAPVPPPAPPPRTFDAATVAPSELVEAARAELETDPASVLDRLTRAIPRAEPTEAGRLRWLAARAALLREDRTTANAHLEALGATDHPLAPWATLRRAQWLADHEPAEAAELAATLLEQSWAGRRNARRVHALALLAADDETAVPLLRALVSESSPRSGAASVGMPLADHLAESDDPEAREEALLLYRRVATRAPKARVGEQAAAKAEALLATLPEERREALAEIPVEDRFARADAFYASMHHRDAERAYADLARSLRDDPEARCRAMLGQGKAMLRRRRRAQGAEHMRAVAERCEDTDVRAWARYKAGRAYGQTGHRAEAIQQYEALLREAPGHRLADDAVFRAALTDMYAGDLESMVTRLETLPERFPDGDMVGEALFRLAMHARSNDDHAAALRWLDSAVRDDRVVGEDAEDIHGRVAYWQARTLQALDRDEEAMNAFAELARRWPLAYYSQQALHRLRELSPERAEAVLDTMRAEPEASPFAWHSEMDAPWFARFVELAAVGENDLARRELELNGGHSDEELVWVAAAVYANAGALPQVARLVRRRHTGFRTALPVADARVRWRLAYPRAYSPLIEEHAEEREVPSSFVRAIAREESSFDPTAVSWAHAYGLVQVILPTARRFGRDLDVPINARTLRQPEVNLAVGTTYMRYLRDRFGANPALVPAAYNAGHGAVDRWLRERGDLPFDEFVERIPYDETRRYTRRVLQTWGVYAWLDEGRLPEIPNRVR